MARKAPTTRASRSGMFASPGLSTLALGGGALALTATLSSGLQSLGLPSIPDIISNPLYLGAAGLGLFLLLK